MQIESADIILLNKVDLIWKRVEVITKKLHALNRIAFTIRTVRCQIDPDLLFCIGRERIQSPPDHKHQPEFESSAIHLRQFTISSVLRNSKHLSL